MRLATHRPPGLVVTDHMFTVPVDHEAPGGATIELFARELVTPDPGAGRAALDGVLPGRARVRGAAADRPQ